MCGLTQSGNPINLNKEEPSHTIRSENTKWFNR
eukprot:UN08623